MNVSSVSPSFGGKGLIILGNQGKNAEKKFLFSEVMEITKKFNTPAQFYTGSSKISIPDAPVEVEKALAEAGIITKIDRFPKLKIWV